MRASARELEQTLSSGVSCAARPISIGKTAHMPKTICALMYLATQATYCRAAISLACRSACVLQHVAAEERADAVCERVGPPHKGLVLRRFGLGQASAETQCQARRKVQMWDSVCVCVCVCVCARARAREG